MLITLLENRWALTGQAATMKQLFQLKGTLHPFALSFPLLETHLYY